jgi:hypothetical protein
MTVGAMVVCWPPMLRTRGVGLATLPCCDPDPPVAVAPPAAAVMVPPCPPFKPPCVPLPLPWVGLPPLPLVWPPGVPPVSIPPMIPATSGEFVGCCCDWGVATLFGVGLTTRAPVPWSSV